LQLTERIGSLAERATAAEAEAQTGEVSDAHGR
jgi:hypothetical protein